MTSALIPLFALVRVFYDPATRSGAKEPASAPDLAEVWAEARLRHQAEERRRLTEALILLRGPRF